MIFRRLKTATILIALATLMFVGAMLVAPVAVQAGCCGAKKEVKSCDKEKSCDKKKACDKDQVKSCDKSESGGEKKGCDKSGK